MTSEEKDVVSTDIRRMPGEWHIEYLYSMGANAAAFFDALGEGRILGVRCSSCDRVFAPPKGFCEFCFVPVDELVELGSRGTIEAVTVVTAPFKGSPTVPYCVAYVRLEGATSSIANFVRGIDLGDGGHLAEELAVGAPVRVVFAPERTGTITDFWFEP